MKDLAESSLIKARREAYHEARYPELPPVSVHSHTIFKDLFCFSWFDAKPLSKALKGWGRFKDAYVLPHALTPP